MIPVGSHIVYTDATSTNLSNNSKESGKAPRSIHWIYIHSNEVIVMQWNKETEELEFLRDIPQSERLALAARRFEFDKNLAPYPTEHFSNWLHLSFHITSATLSSVFNRISISETELPPTVPPFATRTRRLIPGDSQKNMAIELGSLFQLSFVPIPSHEIPIDASPILITALRFENTKRLIEYLAKGQDLYQERHLRKNTSTALEPSSIFYEKQGDMPQLVRSFVLPDYPVFACPYSWVLEEFQVAFVCFCLGESWQGYIHWEEMTDLFLRSDHALTCNNVLSDGSLKNLPQLELYCHFLAVLREQFREMPQDFFEEDTDREVVISQLIYDFQDIVRISLEEDTELIAKEKDMLSELHMFDKISILDHSERMKIIHDREAVWQQLIFQWETLKRLMVDKYSFVFTNTVADHVDDKESFLDSLYN